MRKAILFDMDGTLLNTLEDLYYSTNAALAAYGFPKRTIEEVRQFVGNGLRNLMRQAVPDGEENPYFEDCIRTFKEHYGIHLNDHTGPYPGIIEMLHQLAAKGYAMGVVSNKPDFAVKDLAARYFGEAILVAIGESEKVRRKPAPDTVKQAAKVLGVPMEACIYVGDSEVDLETAKNCKIPCASVSWGFRERELLEKLGAKEIADTTEELVKILTREE